jgi:OmpA-OmpF porin, OOP family
MIRAAILGGGAIALVLLALVCVPRHLAPPSSSTLIPASFHARLEQGTLTLRGSFPDVASRDKILQEAHARFDEDKIRIVDQLAVDSQVAPAPWVNSVSGILPVLRQMNGRGSVIIDGRSIVLSGRVATEQAKATLLRTIAPMTAAGLEVEDHVLASVATSPVRSQHGTLQARLNTVLARGRIEFESNRAMLTPTGRATLDQLIPVLRDAPQAVIEIGGHTDAYGAPEYNMDLSRRRAEAVRDYFVKHGLTQRFDAVGYGATKPRSTEQTQAALQRNRRIELHVKGNGDI